MSENRCPYCNALIASSAGLPVVECPRCGERLAPPLCVRTDTAAAAAPSLTKPLAHTPDARANRRLAWGLVAGMAGLAGLALVFALATVSTRRMHDNQVPRSTRQPILPPLTSPTPEQVVAPARLPALGYLPPGCTLVAGVHLQELLRSPVAEPFKKQRLRLGAIDLSLEALEGWVGIPAGNIDHVVLGSVLEENGSVSLTPPTVLVIRTREPLGVSRFREALQAGAARQIATPDGQPRVIARGKFRDLPLTLWLPDPHTAVVGLFTDLSSVPGRPATDNARFVAATRQALQERLASGQVAWLVVSASRWKDSPLLTALPWNNQISPSPPWEQLRTAVLSLSREAPLRLVAQLQASDENQAQAWERQVHERTQPRWKIAREAAWLTLQWQIEE